MDLRPQLATFYSKVFNIQILHQVPPFGKYLKTTYQVPTTLIGFGDTVVNRMNTSC